MRWWTVSPPDIQVCFLVVLVAMAPAAIEIVPKEPPAAGSSIAIDHDVPRGGSPSARRSPPRLTMAPLAPAAISSPTTRSAARPFPMPPGSRWTPAGSITSPAAGSTTIPAQPGLGMSPTRWGMAATASNVRSYPWETRASYTVGSNRPPLATQPARARSMSSTVSADTKADPAPLSRDTSLDGRNRLHFASRSSMRSRARSSRTASPTTMT